MNTFNNNNNNNNIHKKRLFEQICDHIDESTSPTNHNKRPRLDSIYFICPECRMCPLTPCHMGVCCQNCNLTITLDCSDLTRNAIKRILQMVQSQHKNCGDAITTTTTTTTTMNTSTNKVILITLPDDNIYLTWTCPSCNQLEILL
ncbi:hypothetical protein INT45_013974 [Circinella minor]|uniref:RPA-interacting protein C-terminal domain-containing protein n=1 Tax=Circinella minor TaxID=1195481 RepID=A0A8H7RZ72_9FUNG|nr:hypothetical protein INT45_013974 [Circinella minor]